MNERDFVISIDPGTTTGICICEVNPKRPREFKVYGAWDIPWEERFSLDSLVDSFSERLVAIVYEAFTLFGPGRITQGQIGSEFEAVQVIGILQTAADRYGVTDLLVKQPASLRKRTKILQQHRGAIKGPHMRDAYKHARYWIVTKYAKHKKGALNG